MTTLMSRPASEPASYDGSRLVAVMANLMPDEVLDARRLAVLKRRLLLGLALTVAVLLLAYSVSWLQTHSSRDDLSSAQSQTKALNRTMQTYQPLLTAQSESTQISTTLRSLMADDLQWQTLIQKVLAAGPAGSKISALTGNITAGTTAAGTTTSVTGLNILNATGQVAVGSITITGTTHDKNSVAAYSDRLGTVKGIVSPLVTSVTGNAGVITFSINALITSEALGGRFSAATTTGSAGTPNFSVGSSHTGGK